MEPPNTHQVLKLKKKTEANKRRVKNKKRQLLTAFFYFSFKRISKSHGDLRHRVNEGL